MKGLRLVMLCLVMIAFSTKGGEAADYYVTGSTIDKYRVGARISGTEKVAIPAGQSLSALVKPGNITRIFNGPYLGTLDEYEETAAKDTQSMLQKLLDRRGTLGDCGTKEGGTRQDCE